MTTASIQILQILVVTLTAALSASSTAALTMAENCNADKIKLAGKYAQCRAKAVAKAIKSGDPADYGRCDTKLAEKWAATEIDGGGACPTTGDGVAVQDLVSADISTLALLLAGVRFVDNGDGTITDTQTGLMWEKKTAVNVDTRMSWDDAMGDYMSNLSGQTPLIYEQTGLGGHGDWRLPTAAEIATLSVASSGCIPPAPPCVAPIFLPQKDQPYWTATTRASSPTEAVAISFSTSVSPGPYSSGKVNQWPVRAVRRPW